MKHSLFTAKQSNGSRTGHVKNQFFASEGRHHSMVRRQMRLLNGGGRIDQIHQPEAKARNPIFHIHGAFLVPGHEFPCREQHTLLQLSPKSHQPLLHSVAPRAGLRIRWFGGNIGVNGQRSSALVQHLHEQH